MAKGGLRSIFSAKGSLLSLSVVVHGALALGVGAIEVRKSHAATAIEIAEVKKKKTETPPPAKVEPPPEEKQKPLRRRALTAAPPPVEQAPAATSALEALPDFGLTLSGGIGGGGLAVAAGQPRGSAPAARPLVKRPVAAAPVSDECTEAAGKPRPLNVPQPAFTDEARAAGVVGKVRVELTVDETGRVVEVRLLQGLGHGLDESALAAARSASFEPALRCGKPTRATFTISMRFAAT